MDCDDDDLIWSIAEPLGKRLGEGVWGVYGSNHNADIMCAILRLFWEGHRFVGIL